MRETLKSLQTISYSTRVHVRNCQRILLSLPMESRRRPNGFQVHCLDQCSLRIHTDICRSSEAACRQGTRHRTSCLLRDLVPRHGLSGQCSSRIIVDNVSFRIDVNGILELSVAYKTHCGCRHYGELDING